MALFRTRRHLFAKQVLEQVLACIEIRQAREQLRELLRDGVDVVEMLYRPITEAGAVELPGGPRTAERMTTAMLRSTGRLECGEKVLRLQHRGSPRIDHSEKMGQRQDAQHRVCSDLESQHAGQA
jgi:hypothetical protein